VNHTNSGKAGSGCPPATGKCAESVSRMSPPRDTETSRPQTTEIRNPNTQQGRPPGTSPINSTPNNAHQDEPRELPGCHADRDVRAEPPGSTKHQHQSRCVNRTSKRRIHGCFFQTPPATYAPASRTTGRIVGTCSASGNSIRIAYRTAQSHQETRPGTRSRKAKSGQTESPAQGPPLFRKSIESFGETSHRPRLRSPPRPPADHPRAAARERPASRSSQRRHQGNPLTANARPSRLDVEFSSKIGAASMDLLWTLAAALARQSCSRRNFRTQSPYERAKVTALAEAGAARSSKSIAAFLAKKPPRRFAERARQQRPPCARPRCNASRPHDRVRRNLRPQPCPGSRHHPPHRHRSAGRQIEATRTR